MSVFLWDNYTIQRESLVVDAPSSQIENRFILLPDSSRIILKHGSKLEYRNNFKGASREVVLFGDAYFYIKRKEHQPFIIHTGALRTVVLGTAFTIKATEGVDDVEVTVQRGNVRVELGEDVLAELTANQQVAIENEEVAFSRKNLQLEKALEWTTMDVRFEGQSFAELAFTLEKRYGVRLKFGNVELSRCPVSGKFTGMETIEEFLELICNTRNASYKKSGDNVYVLHGEGCL